MELHIKGYWELLALHKTIMSAKFDPEPYIAEVQGSPFTSSLAFKVFELLLETCKSDGKHEKAKEWLEWQQADKTRSETKLLIERIKTENWWQSANSQEREKFVIDFMSPLKLKPEIQTELIENC